MENSSFDINMRHCCGCINMRKGVIAIGIIGSILTLSALLLQFIALAQQSQIMKNHDDQVGNNLFSFVIIMGIVVCIFKLLSDCLLVYGAKHESQREVSVWLAINLCTIIYVFLIVVFVYNLLVDHETYMEFSNVCILEFVLFIADVIYIYMWYQVYMFSRQLDLDGRTSMENILQNVGVRP